MVNLQSKDMYSGVLPNVCSTKISLAIVSWQYYIWQIKSDSSTIKYHIFMTTFIFLSPKSSRWVRRHVFLEAVFFLLVKGLSHWLKFQFSSRLIAGRPYAFQVTNWVNNMSKFESLEKYFLKVISKEGFFHCQVRIIFFFSDYSILWFSIIDRESLIHKQAL